MNKSALIAGAIVLSVMAIAFGVSGHRASAAGTGPREVAYQAVAIRGSALHGGGIGPYPSASSGGGVRSSQKACYYADEARALLDTAWLSDVIDRVSSALTQSESKSPWGACTTDR